MGRRNCHRCKRKCYKPSEALESHVSFLSSNKIGPLGRTQNRRAMAIRKTTYSTARGAKQKQKLKHNSISGSCNNH
jgi:hypothetical protein